MKSFLAKTGEVKPQWYVIDAEGQILGRLAVRIANILRGRNKPQYTPHVDTGDYVIIINADKVAVSGRKAEDKEYMFFNGYIGREKYRSFSEMRANNPQFVITRAVRCMMPKHRLARQQLKKLKVYAGTEHPHEAQQPQTLTSA